MVPGLSASSSSTTPSRTSSSSSSQESISDNRDYVSDNRGIQIPVPERSGSTNGELRGNPLQDSTETENKNKTGEREEVQRDIPHALPDWLQEFGEKLVDESTSEEPWGIPEQGSQDTPSSSHDSPMEPRAKVEPGSNKRSVYTHFPKDPHCDICMKTKIRRRAVTVVPRAEHFGDLITVI